MFDGHHQPVPADAMPRRFLLEHTCKLDKPKGKSTTSVLKGISDDLEAFYGNVVEHLAGYVAPAPKLPKEHAAGAVEPVSVGLPAAGPIAAPMELERESESSTAPLDASVQDASREVAADTVLAAGAPDESTP
jgi:hypothetical protein